LIDSDIFIIFTFHYAISLISSDALPCRRYATPPMMIIAVIFIIGFADAFASATRHADGAERRQRRQREARRQMLA
jgi:hypothetical protein